MLWKLQKGENREENGNGFALCLYQNVEVKYEYNQAWNSSDCESAVIAVLTSPTSFWHSTIIIFIFCFTKGVMGRRGRKGRWQFEGLTRECYCEPDGARETVQNSDCIEQIPISQLYQNFLNYLFRAHTPCYSQITALHTSPRSLYIFIMLS